MISVRVMLVDDAWLVRDGIARLLADEKVLAYEFEGRRYDCGNKLGYLEATVELALKHPEVGKGFADFLNGRQ